jgi:hypothetical protein
MNCRRRTLLIGLAVLVLLSVGIGAVLLRPMPSEADVAAERVRVGMTEDQARSLFDKSIYCQTSEALGCKGFVYCFADHSNLCFMTHWAEVAEGVQVFRVTSISTQPPYPPVPPLTRLRRVLARLLPDLGE